MRHWGAILCAVWIALACVIIGVRVQDGRAFDTDIQNLLPQNALEPLVRAAVGDAGRMAASRVTVLVSGEDFTRVSDARADLQSALAATGFFAADAEAGEAMARWVYANRNELICETDPARFDADAVRARADALLYAPASMVTGDLLARDPFLLTLQLAQCLSPQAGAPAGDALLATGSLNASPFRIDVQDAVRAAYDDWRARWPDVEVARAGAVFYAEAGARQARAEIALIGGVSAVGIFALLFVCFRRSQAMLVTLLSTLASLAGSLAAALLMFESVHVLVFVFGSALIGITSDYALHYLATGPQGGWAPRAARVRAVARPLAICALSTSLGFAGLGLFGVAIFQQVAVFSVAGVLTAWWFTMTILPLLDQRAPRKAAQHGAWWAKLERPFVAFRPGRRLIWASAGIGVAIIALGILRFSVLDDVRAFQPVSAELAGEEARVREALGFAASPVFLLSHGADGDEARAHEEASLAAMPQAAARDTLAVSRFDPSDARRAENAALLNAQLFEPHLAARRDALGLTRAAEEHSGAAALPQLLAALEGQAEGRAYLVAPFGPAAAAQAQTSAGSILIDPAARYSQALKSFRELAVWAVIAVFGACAVLVLALYRRWRALSVLVAPAAGALIGLALPAALGMPISFFSVAALFVVMGAGIDHSVFLFEAAETDGQSKELVVFLAALTTILAVGLLGLSGTYPVASFGLVVAAGVTAAYAASFIPARRSVRAHNQD
ncbi:MAG TPA: MMPL family transporter [Terricaulis sp.]|nr:MMPL family transporter [Terricaulis sp.]